MINGEWYDADVTNTAGEGGLDTLCIDMIIHRDFVDFSWIPHDWYQGHSSCCDGECFRPDGIITNPTRSVNWVGDHYLQICVPNVIPEDEAYIDCEDYTFLYFDFTNVDVEFYIKCVRGEIVPQSQRQIDSVAEAQAHIRTILDGPQPTHPILLINAVQPYDPDNNDEPTPSPYAFDFTVAAHQIRAFDLPGDGDFAIRARVFAFLW
jgi:hypothetical protein